MTLIVHCRKKFWHPVAAQLTVPVQSIQAATTLHGSYHCDVLVRDIGKCHLPTHGAHDLQLLLMKRGIDLVSLGDEYTYIRPDKVVDILRGLMGTLIKFEDGTHARAGISVDRAKAIVAKELRRLAKHKRMTPATAAPGG